MECSSYVNCGTCSIERTYKVMPCTNNRVEGCNRQFEGDCTTVHPVF